jgi:hypothetical protein
MAQKIDLTGFCWRITRANRWGIRLVIYTAPGLAPDLMRALRNRGLRGRTHGQSAVVFRAKAEIEAVLVALGAPASLIGAVREYHGGDELALARVLYFDGTKS